MSAQQDPLVAELVEALRAAAALIEQMEVKIDGEWGMCRTIEKIEQDGDLPEELVQVRAAIAKATGSAA